MDTSTGRSCTWCQKLVRGGPAGRSVGATYVRRRAGNGHGFVLVERPRENVALVTLNRPERMNAMAFDVMVPLARTLEEISDDNDVRVVVLTGAGRGFCSGADQSDAGALPNIAGLTRPTIALRAMEILDDVVLALRRMHQPVIARGQRRRDRRRLLPVAGLRHPASPPDGAYFRAAGINNGLTASELGLSYLLPRAIGSSRAFEIMLTGPRRRRRRGRAHRARLARRAGDELLDACYELGDADRGVQPARRRAHQAHALVGPRRRQPRWRST